METVISGNRTVAGDSKPVTRSTVRECLEAAYIVRFSEVSKKTGRSTVNVAGYSADWAELTREQLRTLGHELIELASKGDTHHDTNRHHQSLYG